MIGMADGVEILFGVKASSPMIPLLRSMLESLMALDYIHQVDYERRSLAWLCAFLHQEIEFMETIDPSTERGKKFQEDAGKQKRFWSDSFLKPESTTAEVKCLKKKLNSELFRDTEREYQTLKGKKDWLPKWYQLFGGPKNLFEMARRTEWLTFYKIFYRPWSAAVHGTDAGSLVLQLRDGSAEFKDLRNEDGLQFGVDGANPLLETASLLMARKFGSK
jgi:hypothetical protein